MNPRVIHEGVIAEPDKYDVIKSKKVRNMENVAALPQQPDENPSSSKVEKFLIRSADARMMDAEEGKLAVEKGTTAEIKEYGALMVKDQAMLLEALQQLANNKVVELPTGISEKKEHFRKKLSEKDGRSFDEKFIKMITIDHRRDVRMFRRASKFEDKSVSAFAEKYLPLIQSHLEGINMIKQKHQSGSADLSQNR